MGLIGAKEGADQPCGEDYVAEAVESDNAVAVLVQVRRYIGPGNEVPPGCLLVGHPRTATVTLAQPLNGRAVLEVQQGQPVPTR
ncbi:hypothetical protein M1L60_40100 [Actinoplanes sp. TRM 88003]|uniref:Uncharacterized protein n=1 Tax=Paractinoplanes aksuensis TaxID=2939490 RepID=A0ABT1E3H0_9ACTN|nr:hypothetical protein [Actinoplanes aksuensis]MCO8276801.1 hypothetical protein [Actinoplanes aksuensis]